MSTRQIASSALWQIGSQVVMAALSIVTLKLVTHALSVELAGNYNSAYGYLQIFGILADFGLYAVSVREVSRAERKEEVLGTLMTLRIGILTISLGSALAIAWLVPAWQGTPLPISISIAALVPFFTLLAGSLRTIFQIHYRMHFVFVAEVAQRVLTVSLIALPVFLYQLKISSDLRWCLWFLGVGGLGSLLLFLLSLIFGARLMPIRLRFDRKELMTLLKLAAPYGLAYLCTALYRQTDVTMIALLRPQDYETQNAFYGSIQRMADMAYLIPTFLLNSVLPILSERDGKGEDTRALLGKTFFILLLLGSVAFLFASIWSTPLVELLTNNRYLATSDHPGADTALRLIAIPMFMNGIILFSFYILLTRHVWQPLVLTLASAVVISITTNFFLIPRLGFVGAGTTQIIVHLFLGFLLLPQALKVLPMTFTGKQAAQWIGFTLLLGGFLLLTRSFLTGSLLTVGGLLLATLWMGSAAWLLRIHRTLKTSI